MAKGKGKHLVIKGSSHMGKHGGGKKKRKGGGKKRRRSKR
jgi:hypothetical protein